MRESFIYRHLHGAPEIMGIPVHQVLLLVAGGTLGALLVNQWSGAWAIVWALANAACGLVLHLVHAQDRIVLPMLKLRLVHRFQPRVTSYAPSYQRVELREDSEWA
jgi:hypothetical protein